MQLKDTFEQNMMLRQTTISIGESYNGEIDFLKTGDGTSGETTKKKGFFAKIWDFITGLFGGGKKSTKAPSSGEIGKGGGGASTDSGETETSTALGKIDNFAKCLNDEGIKLYSAHWSSYSTDQKSMFGKSSQYLNVIECSLPGEKTLIDECLMAGLQGFPTWKLEDGEKVEGIQDLNKLSELSGCELDTLA